MGRHVAQADVPRHPPSEARGRLQESLLLPLQVWLHTGHAGAGPSQCRVTSPSAEESVSGGLSSSSPTTATGSTFLLAPSWRTRSYQEILEFWTISKHSNDT